MKVLSETGSTNSDLIAMAAQGATEGVVLIADHQTAGKGRQGRTWLDDGGALMMSWLISPKNDVGSWGLIPLMTGLAALKVVRSLGVSKAGLKWPNDLMVGSAKLAGILCETQGEFVVCGMGMNLRWNGEVPEEIKHTATTVSAQTTQTIPDRNEIARLVLGEFETLLVDWEKPGGPARLVKRYEQECLTLSQDQIRFSRTDGTVLEGTPRRLDNSGGLWLFDGEKEHLLTAGDAHHLSA